MIPAIIDSSFSVLVHPEFSLEDVDCSMVSFKNTSLL